MGQWRRGWEGTGTSAPTKVQLIIKLSSSKVLHSGLKVPQLGGI